MAKTKHELRLQYKALRDAAPAPERLLKSDLICRHLGAFCAARGIVRVAAFGSFGSEVDLRPLVASQPLVSFRFPRIRSTDPPRLTWGPPPLVPGAWGLLEPLAAPEDLPGVQLLLVPGLAFAEDGHRLGYGKGFYDAVLAQLPGTVVTLGVAFGFQRCPSLPTGPQDRAVQGLVTETGILWVKGPPL